MAFVDVINDYSQDATGTLTDSNGDTVGYTVTDGAPTINRNNHGDDSARITARGTETVVVTFDDPVVGVTVVFQGSDDTEFYNVIVDGQIVDLAQMVADGEATFANIGVVDTHTLNTDGTISGGINTDGSIGQITFLIPVTSVGAVGAGGPSSGNFDGVEVGIDDTVFDVVCFAGGTMIATPAGPRAVEDLCPGDAVCTRNGAEPIAWIGSRRFAPDVLDHRPHLRPVRITAGALGNGLPTQDLLVSRQHRVLVSSKVAARMFGVNDVLIAAIKLTDLPGIFVEEQAVAVTYFHILLDAHEVVFANGTPTESLFTGPEGIRSLPQVSRDEIFAIFPALAHRDDAQPTACLVPSGKLQKQLVARHAKNQKPLLELFDV